MQSKEKTEIYLIAQFPAQTIGMLLFQYHIKSKTELVSTDQLELPCHEYN